MMQQSLPKLNNKIQNLFTQIRHFRHDSRHFRCTRIDDTAVVLNFRLTFAALSNIFSLFSQTVSGIPCQLKMED